MVELERTWFHIFKNQSKPSQEDLAFLRKMLAKTLEGVKNIYGLYPKAVSMDKYDGQDSAYFYSPEAVVEYSFAVGWETDADGFVVDEDGGNQKEIGVDWLDLWTYAGFKDQIMSLPEEYRDMGSEEDYPVYFYDIGSYDYERATIGIHVKKPDPKVEALAQDIHKKFEEKYGEGQKSSYEPEFPMAYSPEQERDVTPEEAMPDDWKDSLRGEE